jgi:hypothetical protein
MKRLVMSGQVTPPEAEFPEDFFKRPRPKDPEGRLLPYLLDERQTGR